MENTEIVRQFLEIAQEQQRNMSDLGRNDLLLIGCLQSSASPEAIAVAAATVRSTLYSVDELADKIRSLSAEIQHH